jgi:hypothetical protein
VSRYLDGKKIWASGTRLSKRDSTSCPGAFITCIGMTGCNAVNSGGDNMMTFLINSSVILNPFTSNSSIMNSSDELVKLIKKNKIT